MHNIHPAGGDGVLTCPRDHHLTYSGFPLIGAPPLVRFLTIFSALVFSSSKVITTIFSLGISYFTTPAVLFRIEPTLDLPPQVEHSGIVNWITRSAANTRQSDPIDKTKLTSRINRHHPVFCILTSLQQRISSVTLWYLILE
jgi:hypothetical protein